MPQHWNTSRRGRLARLTHHSEALTGNPLNDPPERELLVYLPPGYDEAGDRRYPVIWCLTGYTGSGAMLENLGAWSPPLSWRMDRLIQEGCPPAILAMPDCFTRLGGSQYVDSPATGRYRRYLIDELVPFVDGEFRTLADRDHRGVMGKSSGGYGAICMGLQESETFGAVACHSGDMMFELCYGAEFHKVANALPEERKLLPWFKELESRNKREWKEMAILNILCMAACYSPSPQGESPLAFVLPFDLHTLEMRRAVWDRWLAHDPLRMVDDASCQEALRSLKLLFIDCGTRDEFHLHFGARAMVKKLASHGIAHTYEEFDDGHMSITYRYDRSLPLLSRALSPA
jgi:enterochelin esterase family protein